MKIAHLLPLMSVLATGVLPSPVLVEQNHTDPTMSPAVFADLEFFAQWAAAAFCNYENSVGWPISCSSNACPMVMADGATTLASFSGQSSDIKGIVGLDSTAKQIVISFRGTESVRNWIDDLEFPFKACSLAPGCKVHEGFLKAWDEIGETVFNAVKSASMRYPDYTIVATGHSLGAAVATLGAADLRISGFAVDLFTYGSPRVGNGVFADFVTRQPGLHYRVTHLDDMVPRLPPLMLGYRHAGIEYWLWNGTAKTTAYTAADVKICTGDANEDCNGGQHGHDSTAHAYYLEKMSGCDPDGGQGKTILHEVLNGLNVASDVADLLDLGDVLFRGREHKIIP